MTAPGEGANQGAAFSVPAKGENFKTLRTFLNGPDGGYPFGTPNVTREGDIFGVAAYGGVKPCYTATNTLISTYGCGTIFEYKRDRESDGDKVGDAR